MPLLHSKKMLYSSLYALVLVFVLLPGSTSAESVEVVVTGLQGAALGNVKAALSIPEGLVTDGRVNRQWLERFEDQANQKVRVALEPFGYYAPHITIRREVREGTQILILVDVNAGIPVRVTEASVSLEGPGSKNNDLRRIIGEFPLRQGDVLLHQQYAAAKGGIKAKAVELGFLDAEFTAAEILVSIKDSSAKINLRLNTGIRYHFGETTFEGADDYPRKFLERYLSFREGETFSFQKIGETQFNFMDSDRFRDVTISPQREAASAGAVPIVIKLSPSPSRRLRLGLGFGTDTGFRFSLGYDDVNLFDRGREFHSELNLSSRIQRLTSAYIVPSSKDPQSFSSFRFDMRREDLDTYDTRLVSFESSKTRRLGRGKQVTVYARLQHEESTISEETPSSFLVLPGVRFSQQRYDDLTRPSKGYGYSLEMRGTHEYIGSNVTFLQTILEGNIIVPLPWRTFFLSRVKIGTTAASENLTQLPASLRFFAGGDRTVRGFDYQSLGPEDEDGDVIGGKHLLVGSLELERLLFTDWGLAIFYDAGNAFDSFSRVKLFQSAGAGARYYSKVGPVRLDIAKQLDANKYRLHVTVGFIF